MSRCVHPWNGGALMAATPPGQRYPYIYPRDLAAGARAIARLIERGRHVQDGLAHLETSARFLLATQREDGYHGQRYDLEGRDRSIYRQEDNPAHAARVLATYLRTAESLGQKVPDAELFLDGIERSVRHAVETTYRPGVSLFYSTTTVHESGMERGYTLWNNLAHLRAMEAYLERCQALGRENGTTRDIARLERIHRENVGRRFSLDGELVRRITPNGRVDRRPDITLLAPFYFGFHDLAPDAMRASADRIERELWDPELGMLQRYLPYAEDPDVHLHAGNGPWLAYTAMLAQYRAATGEKDAARRILEACARHANARGELPEHLSTRERFLDWWDREWETGVDFRKEFDTEILLPDVGFSRIVEELQHMKTEYERLRQQVMEEHRDVLRFAVPLMWSHAEFVGALLELEG